jgi:hypothetical protein
LESAIDLVTTRRCADDCATPRRNVAGVSFSEDARSLWPRAPQGLDDIAYVLLHNDAGGPTVAAQQVIERFPRDLVGATATALEELLANFATASAQGSFAFATTMFTLHSDLDVDILANDAVAAVDVFVTTLLT